MTDTKENLLTHGAVALRDRLAAGDISASKLVEACLTRIAAREPTVQAWSWLDPDHARAQARALDAHLETGGPSGPLHGMPVGLKDVIDTAGIPTENGCPLDAGRVPDRDATVVTRLKDAGAIIMGKTVTTELAFMHPGKTRNPHNSDHTPGGSSSGSAAAVADGMVPLAIGTQTGGSVIRPASFCGVTGFKPTFNAIPRHGVLLQSHTLDTVGVFARDPEGAALIGGVLMGNDLTLTRPVEPPVLAFVKPPEWDDADLQMHAALARLTGALGPQVTEVALPWQFEDAAAQRGLINYAEMAHYYDRYWERDPEQLGPPTREAIATGQSIPAKDYVAAIALRTELYDSLAPIFARYDAILCPAAPGPAPHGLGSTGDSIFNGLWTYTGVPAVTLPVLSADDGLPIGAQLVGPRGSDDKLMAIASWLASAVR